jgi:predicted Rossmann-fold nucleotide-binding protein
MVDKPLILVGPMWKKIMRYTSAHLFAHNFISDTEQTLWRYASTPDEAARMLL